MANLGIQNNNPGNLRDTKTGNFQVFNSPEEGHQALIKDIQIKQSGQSSHIKPGASLEDFANVWAPASDKNKPKQYASTLAKVLGINTTEAFDSVPPEKLAEAVKVAEGTSSMKSSNTQQNSRQLPHDKMIANINSMEQQGAKPEEIQGYLDSLKGQQPKDTQSYAYDPNPDTTKASPITPNLGVSTANASGVQEPPRSLKENLIEGGKGFLKGAINTVVNTPFVPAGITGFTNPIGEKPQIKKTLEPSNTPQSTGKTIENVAEMLVPLGGAAKGVKELSTIAKSKNFITKAVQDLHSTLQKTFSGREFEDKAPQAIQNLIETGFIPKMEGNIMKWGDTLKSWTSNILKPTQAKKDAALSRFQLSTRLDELRLNAIKKAEQEHPTAIADYEEGINAKFAQIQKNLERSKIDINTLNAKDISDNIQFSESLSKDLKWDANTAGTFKKDAAETIYHSINEYLGRLDPAVPKINEELSALYKQRDLMEALNNKKLDVVDTRNFLQKIKPNIIKAGIIGGAGAVGGGWGAASAVGTAENVASRFSKPVSVLQSKGAQKISGMLRK